MKPQSSQPDPGSGVAAAAATWGKPGVGRDLQSVVLVPGVLSASPAEPTAFTDASVTAHPGSKVSKSGR